MDFSAYKEALEAAGLTLFLVEDEGKPYRMNIETADVDVWTGFHFDGGWWMDNAESILRAAVLEVAPGSYACPSWAPEAGKVAVLLRTEEGFDMRGNTQGPCFTDSYPMAWLEGIKRLHDSGVVWKEGGR